MALTSKRSLNRILNGALAFVSVLILALAAGAAPRQTRLAIDDLDKVGFPFSFWKAGCTARSNDVQTFNSSGTWTKAAGFHINATVTIEAWGGGGGGSGGGGGGGSGGQKRERTMLLSAVGATETVTVGAGGGAGDWQSHAGYGGNTTFGTHIEAVGGYPGEKGINDPPTGGGVATGGSGGTNYDGGAGGTSCGYNSTPGGGGGGGCGGAGGDGGACEAGSAGTAGCAGSSGGNGGEIFGGAACTVPGAGAGGGGSEDSGGTGSGGCAGRVIVTVVDAC